MNGPVNNPVNRIVNHLVNNTVNVIIQKPAPNGRIVRFTSQFMAESFILRSDSPGYCPENGSRDRLGSKRPNEQRSPRMKSRIKTLDSIEKEPKGRVKGINGFLFTQIAYRLDVRIWKVPRVKTGYKSQWCSYREQVVVVKIRFGSF